MQTHLNLNAQVMMDSNQKRPIFSLLKRDICSHHRPCKELLLFCNSSKMRISSCNMYSCVYSLKLFQRRGVLSATAPKYHLQYVDEKSFMLSTRLPQFYWSVYKGSRNPNRKVKELIAISEEQISFLFSQPENYT